jgi:hypothetical protein
VVLRPTSISNTSRSFNSKPGAFFERGYLYSVIIDGLRRIGSLLAGATPSSDVTYITPISFLLNLSAVGFRGRGATCVNRDNSDDPEKTAVNLSVWHSST